MISRLEDIAEAFEKSGNTVSTVESGGSLTGALGNVRSLIAAPPSNAAYAPDATEAPEMLTGPIREFDAFLEKSVGPYVKLSNDLGGSVAAQAAAVLASFHEQRKILVTASRTKKPDASGLQEILQPMENYAAHVVSIQENNPFDSMHKHLSCVADGIPALGWISIEMRAFNHVDKFFGYAQYFGNKVIKEYKGRLVRQCHSRMA